jgi:hypothetical protein
MFVSACFLMALSINSEFYELPHLSEEVIKCFSAHLNEYESCSDAYFTRIKNDLADYGELMIFNPESLPDSVKKNNCCGFYSWESCTLKAVAPTPGCVQIVEQYLNETETIVLKPNTKTSMKKLCVKFPKESKDCQ